MPYTQLTPETNHEAVYQRLRHLATLTPDSRQQLERQHARHLSSRLQDEPEEYMHLAECHYPTLERYRSLRQFYDQLAFRADAKGRYFSFLDENNCSICNRPAIRLRKLRPGGSIHLLRTLRAAGELPLEDDLGIFCGAWFVATQHPAMIEALRALSWQGKCSHDLSENILFFRAWGLNPDEFDAIHDLLLHHQTAYVLPFCNEVERLKPRVLTDIELNHLHSRQDAWL